MNRFGGNCFGCHAKAETKFDMVCEHAHGCDPLPVSDDVFRSHPECRPATALIELSRRSTSV